jgi:hypothetical protein
VSSTPPGASIVLDGHDIGALTPRTIPTLPATRAHAIEVRLEGYLPCQRSFEPAIAGEVRIDCPLQKAPPPIVPEPAKDPDLPSQHSASE